MPNPTRSHNVGSNRRPCVDCVDCVVAPTARVQPDKQEDGILCRLCKGQGFYHVVDNEWDCDMETCCVCKGVGILKPSDIDQWTFADLDESLGPEAMGVKRVQYNVVPKNATWQTSIDEERGLMWAELVTAAVKPPKRDRE